MRISTLQIFNIANRSMAEANQAMIKTQEQLSTGRRVLHPSDDPVASTKIMQLTEELASIKQFERNINIAQNNLVIEEFVLDSVNTLVQRIQELAVTAGNTATLGVNEYRALASEVDSRMEELQSLLNTKNANGDFIFGGFKSQGEPFSGDSQGGFRYNGDEGQQFIKIASNTKIAASDSGKTAFVDIDSSHNTITTYSSPANTSNPPVAISVGEIIDQKIFDEFYPEDIVITFNADNAITPPGKNFTATERSTGRVLAENQVYSPGESVEVQGTQVRIFGTPVSGTTPVPASLNYGSSFATAFPVDFTAPGEETFSITVAGHTETLTLNSLITSGTDLAAALNDVPSGNSAALANLGLTVDNIGIRMPKGINFTVGSGTANINLVTGLNSISATTSTDGVVSQPGDRLFIDSSNKQDLLTTMARFSIAMQNYDGSGEARGNIDIAIANTLNNLDNAQTSVLDVRAKIGARTNTLESIRSLHLDSQLVTTEILSDLRDTDYADTSTRLAAQSLVLQAAQSSFIRVSQLTLLSQL